jgi:hypothetical protein
MFRNLWDPSLGSIKRASLKLRVIFCVRSRCLVAWYLYLWCVCLVRRVENYPEITFDTHTTGFITP